MGERPRDRLVRVSTVGGYISGNGYIWPFNPGWQSHLNTQGAQDMARLNAFVRSIPWQNLVPSGLGSIANRGSNPLTPLPSRERGRGEGLTDRPLEPIPLTPPSGSIEKTPLPSRERGRGEGLTDRPLEPISLTPPSGSIEKIPLPLRERGRGEGPQDRFLRRIGIIVIAGGSDEFSDDYVSAAATPDGTLIVAYVPPAHTGDITIDMSILSHPARARWFNPTTADYTTIADNLPNSGPHTFTPPGDNGSGDSDWVLVMDRSAQIPALSNCAAIVFSLLLLSVVANTNCFCR